MGDLSFGEELGPEVKIKKKRKNKLVEHSVLVYTPLTHTTVVLGMAHCANPASRLSSDSVVSREQSGSGESKSRCLLKPAIFPMVSPGGNQQGKVRQDEGEMAGSPGKGGEEVAVAKGVPSKIQGQVLAPVREVVEAVQVEGVAGDCSIGITPDAVGVGAPSVAAPPEKKDVAVMSTPIVLVPVSIEKVKSPVVVPLPSVPVVSPPKKAEGLPADGVEIMEVSGQGGEVASSVGLVGNVVTNVGVVGNVVTNVGMVGNVVASVRLVGEGEKVCDWKGWRVVWSWVKGLKVVMFLV